MAVILMCGPTGAGKSTYARRLVDEGWVRLSFDAETWRLGAPGEALSQPDLDRIEDDLRERLLVAAGRGDDVVVDFSFSTRAMRDDYRALVAHELGLRAETVFLDIDRDIALERIRSRRGTGPDDLRLTEEEVVAHVAGFERPTFAEYPLRVVGDLAFRHAALGDVEALLAFWAEAAENAARPADDARLVEQLLDRDPAAVIVAEQAGRLVGTVVAGWDGWRANLYRLAVHPWERGRGVGRRLLNHAEHRLEALGATRLCAMVLDENDPGAGLWRSAGYAPQGEWSRWVKPVTSS